MTKHFTRQRPRDILIPWVVCRHGYIGLISYFTLKASPCVINQIFNFSFAIATPTIWKIVTRCQMAWIISYLNIFILFAPQIMDVIAMISQMEYSDTLSNKAALSQPILNIAICEIGSEIQFYIWCNLTQVTCSDRQTHWETLFDIRQTFQSNYEHM